ncbi:MAG: type VI secretion system TssO [Moheibacter sp.]
MDVLNKEERTISFLVFLGVFAITVFIIIGAIYFDYYLPWKENSELKKENELMSREFVFQEEFAGKMEELKTSIDSLNAPGQDFYYNQQRAISTIISMQQSIPTQDSLVRDNMYDNIIITNRELIDAKKTIQMMGGSKDELDKLLQQIETYKSELEIVKRDLEVCRQISKAN